MADVDKPRLFCSQRLVFAVLSMLGMMMVYMTRSNTSVVIVCMVDMTYNDQQSNYTVPACRLGNNHTRKDGEFKWLKRDRAQVLSAFYYAYWSTKFPGGVLVRYTGPKVIILGVVLGSALFNLLNPVAARADYWLLIVDRVLLGAVQGAAFPVMQQMLSSWAPPAERSTMAGIVYTGSQFGIVLAHLAGYVCDSMSWDWVYYITGALACVWSVLWLIFVADTPAKQRCISEQEKEYIADALAATANKKPVPFCKVPWRKIATSMPVYAVCVAQFSMDFGAFTIAQCMPSFLDDVLRLRLSDTGFASAVPFIGKMVMISVSGIAADAVQKRGWLTRVNTRRTAMIIAAVGQSTFLMACGWLRECSPAWLAIVLFTASVGLSGAQYAAHVPSYLDIAPAYAGIIVGIANSLSSISGALGPSLMGVMTKGGSIEQWRAFFGLNVAVVLSGATFYCIFIQGHAQPWAANDAEDSGETSGTGEATSGEKASDVSFSIDDSESPKDSI